MSVSIEKSERFQTEYANFQSRVEQVENMRVKGELDQLMKILLKEIRNLDNSHKNMLSGNIMPEAVTDSRQKILNIRKKIEKFLKDYENSVRSQ